MSAPLHERPIVVIIAGRPYPPIVVVSVWHRMHHPVRQGRAMDWKTNPGPRQRMGARAGGSPLPIPQGAFRFTAGCMGDSQTPPNRDLSDWTTRKMDGQAGALGQPDRETLRTHRLCLQRESRLIASTRMQVVPLVGKWPLGP
jgi:hypothetical protein